MPILYCGKKGIIFLYLILDNFLSKRDSWGRDTLNYLMYDFDYLHLCDEFQVRFFRPANFHHIHNFDIYILEVDVVQYSHEELFELLTILD